MSGPILDDNFLQWTVVTTVYNGEKHIRKCLESVATQSSGCIHLIQDGGSTDGTLDIISCFAERSDRLSVISEGDKGIYDGMNKGVSRVDTPYVAILNCDDVFTTADVLERVLEIFERRPEVSLVYCDINYVDDVQVVRTTNISCDPFRLEDVLRGTQLPHPGMFVRREVYRELIYDSELRLAADYKFQLQFLQRFHDRSAKLGVVAVNQLVGGASQRDMSAFILGKVEMYQSLREVLGISRLRSVIVILLNLFKKLAQKRPLGLSFIGRLLNE